MALVRKFEERRMERNSLHREIGATYSVFGPDDKKILQIDTFGTDDRQIPGKKSQTIQLDEMGAKELYLIMKKHFGFK